MIFLNIGTSHVQFFFRYPKTLKNSNKFVKKEIRENWLAKTRENSRFRHRLIPRIFRAKTPILYPICFHEFFVPKCDFLYSICFHEFFVPKFQFCIPSVFTNFRENARFRHHTPENVKIVKIGSLRSKNK